MELCGALRRFAALSFLWHGMQRVRIFSSPQSPPPSTTRVMWSASHNPPPHFRFQILRFLCTPHCFLSTFASSYSALRISLATFFVSVLQNAQMPLSRLYTRVFKKPGVCTHPMFGNAGGAAECSARRFYFCFAPST